MSLGTHRIGATLTGAEANGSKARSSRRDLPENSRARVHEVEVGWMAGAGGAHPACAKGREARADASRRRNSNAVDAASRDPEVNRCDGVRRFSSNEKNASRRFTGRETREHPYGTRRFGFVALVHLYGWAGTAGLDPGSRGSSALARATAGRSGRTELEPFRSCPR